MATTGSIIANYNKLVSNNNGVHRDMSNKCGIISIGNSMGCDSQNYIDLIIEMLHMDNHQKLDFNKERSKLQNICNLLDTSIYVHCARRMDCNMIRIWRSCQFEIKPDSRILGMEIHILWYGDHFEYVDWNKITDYPEYNETVYNSLEKYNDDTPDSFLYRYNIVYSGIL